VPGIQSSKVEVYLFLALKRSRDRKLLPGVWQPVTGKRHLGESPLRCAAREVLEETGLEPERWWALETITLYLEQSTGALVVLPLYAAEVRWGAKVTISEEHEAARFLPRGEAVRRFLWESQRRGLEAVRREVLRGGPLAEALEVTKFLPPRRARSPRAKKRGS
jgi:dATP pyrophosphohydrolase